MARVIAAALLALFAVAAQTISIQFGTVAKEEIERRLRASEDNNLKRERRLRELFEQSQCTGDHLTEQAVKGVKAPNVVCMLSGETDSLIVVGAHFDFVNSGKGVVDNWSGCSLLPSLFESLKEMPRRHTLAFVGFTAEEQGMIGSKFYVKEMGSAIQRVSAMVNLDSIGTSPTKVEVGRGDKRLLNALATIAHQFKLPINAVNVHEVGRSDSDSFQDRKVPTVNIHSLTSETFPILHSPRDRIEAVRMDNYYDTYLLLRAYLAYLDQLLDAPAAEAGDTRSK